MDEQGAEAVIRSEDGKIEKKRPVKKYRHPELDERLRKERTETEARLMEDARKHGVPVPEIDETEESKILMNRVDGNQLKDELEPPNFRELGKNLAILHSIDIMHGDLTTSNVIVGDRVNIIDFGLSFRSQRIEDRAVDVYLLKQVLDSSHPEVKEESWNAFLEGYRDYERYEEVMERFEEVKERGRYK